MSTTTAPISEVAIANMAAGVLDESRPILSLDDNTSIARFMSREFGYCRDELIRLFPWNFCKTRIVLAPDATAPAFEYAYAYTLPDDCLRLIPLTLDGSQYSPALIHALEGRTILTNLGPVLYARYIRKETNAARFDPLFARCLATYLAVLASMRVTGKSSYFDKSKGLFQEALWNAFHVNSLEGGSPGTYDPAMTEDALNVLSIRGVGM